MNRAINDDPVSEGIMMRRKTYLVGAAGLFTSAVNHNNHNDTSTDFPDSRSGNTDDTSHGQRFVHDDAMKNADGPGLNSAVIGAAICAVLALLLVILAVGACCFWKRKGQTPALPLGPTIPTPPSNPGPPSNKKGGPGGPGQPDPKPTSLTLSYDQFVTKLNATNQTIELGTDWTLAPDRTIEITREDCAKIVEKIVAGTWKLQRPGTSLAGTPNLPPVKTAAWTAYQNKVGQLGAALKQEKVTFKLISVDAAKSINQAKTSTKHLIPCHIVPGDMYEEKVTINFANKIIGGGVLDTGMVQEEIGMCMIPELIVNLLLMGTAALKPNEALVTSNLIKYNVITGYSNTAQLDTSSAFVPASPHKMTVVSMDATDFRPPAGGGAAPPAPNDCDVVKAMAGLSLTDPLATAHHCNKEHVAGGLWGCGVFAGNDTMRWKKSLVTQWLAAALSGAVEFRFHQDPSNQITKADLEKLVQDVYAYSLSVNPPVAKLYEFLMTLPQKP